jgi:hypothetical protein
MPLRIGFVPLDTFVDAPERSEVAVPGTPLGHDALRRELGGSDAGTPFVDVAEVVEDLPHRFNRGTDLAGDCELWHLGILLMRQWPRLAADPYRLISICAAGAMARAMILERDV